MPSTRRAHKEKIPSGDPDFPYRQAQIRLNSPAPMVTALKRHLQAQKWHSAWWLRRGGRWAPPPYPAAFSLKEIPLTKYVIPAIISLFLHNDTSSTTPLMKGWVLANEPHILTAVRMSYQWGMLDVGSMRDSTWGDDISDILRESFLKGVRKADDMTRHRRQTNFDWLFWCRTQRHLELINHTTGHIRSRPEIHTYSCAHLRPLNTGDGTEPPS